MGAAGQRALWSALVFGALALPGASAGAAGPYVYVVPAAGGAARALGPGSDPVVSPDGTEIGYVRDGHLWLMRADGGDQRRLTSGFGARPAWSPDGSRLVYTLWNVDPCLPPPKTKCAVTDIWTVNVDGSGERKLLPHALEPAWSPDGRLLLYREFAGPAEQGMPVGPLEVARPDGSRVRTLSDGVSTDGTSSRAAWSPDGKRVVFERTPGSATEHRLFVIRADGTGLRRLAVGRYPAWSPSGKLIAFGRTLRKGVWVIPAAGGKARRISSSGSCPTWSPGGRWIALLTTTYRARPSPQPPAITTTLSLARPDGRRPRVLATALPCEDESSFPSPPSWSRHGAAVYFSRYQAAS